MIPAPPASPPPRRRWLRLSLRALMILVVLIGAGAGWVANKIRTQRQAIAAVRDAGGTVTFDYQAEVASTNAQGRPIHRTEPKAPAWLRRWLGDELFRSVRGVSFSRPVGAGILGTVARFDRLETLELSEVREVGGGFEHLQGLGQLRSLYANGPGVTDAALAEIARVSSLRTLRLGKVAATGAGFAHLAALPGLDFLAINECPHFTDEGGAQLVAGLPGLRRVQLVGLPKITATLAALGRHHPDLVLMILQQSGVTDDDLAALEQIRGLEQLNIQRTPITDAGLAHLRPLKKLNYLLANGRGLTDEGLKHIGALAALEELHVAGSRMTDAGLAHLAGLPLKQLAIAATQVTDAGMPALARLTGLERLSLIGHPGLTDAALGPLGSLKRLQRLDVRRTRITAEGVAALRQALPSLARVQVGATAAALAPPPAAK